ncbi:LysR family transcriptional regulator [Roseateles sp.]|jgi:DNA-binding transcriptional LysR family regulator|uniref:LysR family transcriptional regulator n=1 Tax=Roseateles sp. TaxID=1971397 RepID=UPI00391C89FF
MLDQLKRMAVLATVVEQGSFVAAARKLRSTTSAVSQQIRALERDMGVTLLHRSTRRLALTPAGARFHEGCAAMLAAAQQAQNQLLQLRDAPEGELRVAAAVGFGRHLGPALAPLLAAHPGLRLHLEVDDGFSDLLALRIDLALRYGRLPDSAWVAQKIGHKSMALYAAPAYLARHGAPASLDDLAQHQWLALGPETESPRTLHLLGAQGAGQGQPVELMPPAPRVSSNNQFSLQQLCEAGLGLALLSPSDIEESLQLGRLLRVMPAWQPPPLPVWALSPQRDAQPAKVRHAIEALRQHFAALPA